MTARLSLAALAVLAACAGKPMKPIESARARAARERGGDAGGVRAPELKGGQAWLNTDRPLTIAELRGHVVLIDFWTLGCINCIHVIPELKAVERRFAADPVVVIGVHSGKFAAEKAADRIRASLGRYGVEHPVVVDSGFQIWESYGARAWPTLVLIDETGKIVWADTGEPEPGLLVTLVGERVAAARARGTLAAHKLAIRRPADGGGRPLSYPGKLAVAGDGRIAIADSAHHRIVIVDAAGTLLDVAGSGLEGLADGRFDAAAFRRPQGLAFGGPGEHTLYVADTENHALRALDLRARTVTTIAGTGKKAEALINAPGPGREVALRSPWDLALDGSELYVAMAGSHQIWVMHLSDGEIAPFAGSGIEDLIDSDEGLRLAAFSQPSGLALGKGEAGHRTLYVADAEVSAVRAIDLQARTVKTLVGTGLFDFGDKDGRGDDVLLQHALGVTALGGFVYVADTYNNKVKRIDPKTRQTTTIAGGKTDALFEPGAIRHLADGRLLVADTNNHRLRIVDPKTGALADFPLRGLSAPKTAGIVIVSSGQGADHDATPRTTIHADGSLGPGAGTLVIELAAPPGAHLTEDAPLEITVAGAGLTRAVMHEAELHASELPVRIPLVMAGPGPIDVDLLYYWCTEGDESACVPERARLTLDVARTGTGGTATLRYSPSP